MMEKVFFVYSVLAFCFALGIVWRMTGLRGVIMGIAAITAAVYEGVSFESFYVLGTMLAFVALGTVGILFVIFWPMAVDAQENG